MVCEVGRFELAVVVEVGEEKKETVIRVGPSNAILVCCEPLSLSGEAGGTSTNLSRWAPPMKGVAGDALVTV